MQSLLVRNFVLRSKKLVNMFIPETFSIPIAMAEMKLQYDAASGSSNTFSIQPTHATFDYKVGEPLITIKSMLSPDEISQVSVLISTIKSQYPQSSAIRLFNGYGGTAEGGGNHVMHINEYMQIILPKVMKRIIANMNAGALHAKWYPYPQQLGIRCVEELTYCSSSKDDSSKDLSESLALHVDSESVFTIAIMLADPTTDFTGGDFVISRCTPRQVVHEDVCYDPSDSSSHEDLLPFDSCDAAHLPAGLSPAASKRRKMSYTSDDDNDDLIMSAAVSQRPGDAIMFNSNSMHGVTTVTSGQRKVLVIELWPYADADYKDLRPSARQYYHRVKLPTLLMT